MKINNLILANASGATVEVASIELSDKKGGEFRRISVEFLFFDALER